MAGLLEPTAAWGTTFPKTLRCNMVWGWAWDFGRKESATGPLAGMGSIDAKVEYGAFLNYAPDRNWRLSSVVRYGSGDTGQGLSANFGANYALNIAPQWRLDWGVSTNWANSQTMQSYFGVSEAQSLQSGNAVYSPGAGLRDVGASLNLSYQVTPKISVSGSIKATSLVGDARNSPLATSPQSVSGSLSIGYAF
jgi:outer membrane protein